MEILFHPHEVYSLVHMTSSSKVSVSSSPNHHIRRQKVVRLFSRCCSYCSVDNFNNVILVTSVFILLIQLHELFKEHVIPVYACESKVAYLVLSTMV